MTRYFTRINVMWQTDDTESSLETFRKTFHDVCDKTVVSDDGLMLVGTSELSEMEFGTALREALVLPKYSGIAWFTPVSLDREQRWINDIVELTTLLNRARALATRI